MTRKEVKAMVAAILKEAKRETAKNGELHTDDIDNFVTEAMKKYNLKYDEAVYHLDFLYQL